MKLLHKEALEELEEINQIRNLAKEVLSEVINTIRFKYHLITDTDWIFEMLKDLNYALTELNEYLENLE